MAKNAKDGPIAAVQMLLAASGALDTDPYFIEVYAGYSVEQLDNVYNIIGTDKVIERPKMLCNDKTGNYVIWFHSDDSTEKNSYKYDVGMAGVAVSDSPFGPFRLIDRYRLNQCPTGQIDCYPTSKGEARVWSADSILGDWRNDGNPCRGEAAGITFDTQSTSLFRAENGRWIYYGDRWNGFELHDSRYIWLPVEFEGDKLTISWRSEWSWK